MATVTVQLPLFAGNTGLSLRLYGKDNGTLVNAGGDALTETSNGHFQATVAETLDSVYRADVLNGSAVVYSGWLNATLSMMIDDPEGANIDNLTAMIIEVKNKTDQMVFSTPNVLDVKVVSYAVGVEIPQYTPAETGELQVFAGADFSTTLSVAVPANWSKIRFFAKANESDPDSAAIVMLEETNPAAGTDGLRTLNGATATASQGSLTVNQIDGEVVVNLKAVATTQLAPKRKLTSDGDNMLLSGRWNLQIVTATGAVPFNGTPGKFTVVRLVPHAQ